MKKVALIPKHPLNGKLKIRKYDTKIYDKFLHSHELIVK